MFMANKHMKRCSASSVTREVQIKKKSQSGISLVVQWPRLRAPTAGDVGLIPGWGTKIAHAATWPKKEKKVTMTYHYILLCSLKLKSDNTKSWQECGATGTLSEKVRHVNTLGNILAILKINWTIYLPYESFLGIYPREKETMYPYQDLYTNVPTVLFTTVLNRKQRSYSRTSKACSVVQCCDGMLIRDPEKWNTDRATNMNFQKYFNEQTKPGSKD